MILQMHGLYVYHIVITSRFSAQVSVMKGARKLQARQFIFKLFFFSFVLFIITVYLKKQQQQIFVQNLEPRLFPALYHQLGWFVHNQAIRKKLKIPFPVHYCVQVLYVHHYITYVCQYMPHFTLCPNDKQTTEVFFCFWLY